MGKRKKANTASQSYRQMNIRGCKLCGNMLIGREIASHVENLHGMDYQYYRKYFEDFRMIITDIMRNSFMI
jgi:hypothetical protein